MRTAARWLAVAFLAVAALPALAADEAPVLRQRAEQLAAADRCEEALPRARRARELDAKDARAALVEGRCLLRLGQYRLAVEPLTAARDLDASLPGVSTDLAQAHYHLDEIDAASEELDRAERENPDDARTQLYRGLVLSRQAKQKEAAAAFDRAGGLDPSYAGIAGLYAGRTWASAQDREKAQAAFERARAADPNSEWGRSAAAELETLDAANRRHVWAKVRAGVEHDSNVTLQSQYTFGRFPDFQRTHERDDTVAVFEVEGGLEFFRDPKQSSGVVAGYNGNAHDNVHELDMQYPWVSLWYDRRLSEDTFVRLQPFFGYAWLETNPFVIHGGGTVSISHTFSDRFSAQLFSRLNANDFLYHLHPDPPEDQFVRNRNRDGVESETGVEGTIALVPGSTSLRAGTAYSHYWAEGRDWDRNGLRTWLGATQQLPWSLLLDVLGTYYYLPFSHRSSYDTDFARYTSGGGPTRTDHVYDVQGELSYPLASWARISARGQYTSSVSNVEVFDYDRWVAGGYLTLTWGHTL